MKGNKMAAGSNEVHSAAMFNDPERLVRVLKKEDANVNQRDVNGWMPLHVSWVSCTRECFRYCWLFLFSLTRRPLTILRRP
jgi:hypothetical protein